MVLCVVTGLWITGNLATANDAPRSPVLHPGCSDGVFTVNPPRFAGQKSLAIAKNRTVLFIGKRTALADELVRFLAFSRQICHPHNG